MNKTSSDVFACVGPLPWRETIQCRGSCPLLAEVCLTLLLMAEVRAHCWQRGLPDIAEVRAHCWQRGLPDIAEVRAHCCQKSIRGPVRPFPALLCPLTFVFTLISFQMFSKDHAEQITPLSGPTFTACTVRVLITLSPKFSSIEIKLLKLY